MQNKSKFNIMVVNIFYTYTARSVMETKIFNSDINICTLRKITLYHVIRLDIVIVY